MSFDAEPLGTASLAQVHRATLKDGREVAVKVQHPYVLGNSKVDMKTMEILCKIMSFVFPDFKMQWLVEESKKNLPIELDFLNEGRNAEKVSKLFLVFHIKFRYSIHHITLTISSILGGRYVQRIQMVKNTTNNLEYFNKTCTGHGIFTWWSSKRFGIH